MRTDRMLELGDEALAIVRDILAKRIPERTVYAFGSRTNGRSWRLSDLDLAVAGAVPLAAGMRSQLLEDFDQSDLPIVVDVVDLADVAEEFRMRIERDFVLVQAGALAEVLA